MLDRLPSELIVEIGTRLPLASLGRLAQSNKYLLRTLHGEKFLWKSKTKCDYRSLYDRMCGTKNSETDVDWFEVYKAEKFHEAVLRKLSDKKNKYCLRKKYEDLSTVRSLLFDYTGPEISKVTYCPASLEGMGDVLMSSFECLFSTRLDIGPPDEIELFIKCNDGTGRFIFYFLRYECSGGYGCIRVGESALFLLNHLSKKIVKSDEFLSALQEADGFPLGPPKLSQSRSLLNSDYCPLQNKPLIRYGAELPYGYGMKRAGFEFLGDWSDINDSLEGDPDGKVAEARQKLLTPRPSSRLHRRYSEGDELVSTDDDEKDTILQ